MARWTPRSSKSEVGYASAFAPLRGATADEGPRDEAFWRKDTPSEAKPDTGLYLAKRRAGRFRGARPLRRAIQELILDELSLQILEEKIKEGDTVKVDVKNDEIILVVD